MKVIESVRRWVSLASLVGLAAGSLAIQACTRASPGGQDDGAVDAAQVDDAGLDAGVTDADTAEDAEMPDARLWDVICE